MMHVAVTRAEPGASRTAERLRAKGATPLIAPLLTLVYENKPLDLFNAQAVLFTSINGVEAAARLTPRRDVLALCVGKATADAARAAGFTDAISANGDARALFALCQQRLEPNGAKIIHACGEDLAFDLAGALRAAGYIARSEIVYRAAPVAALPPALADAIDRGALNAILFHSPRAAKIFAGLIGARSMAAIDAACLSPAVAEPLRGAHFKRLLAALRPNEEALLQRLLA